MDTILERLLPTLGKKIIAAVMLTLFAAASVFVFFAHRTGYALLEEQAQVQAHEVTEFGKSILELVMLEGKKDRLQSVLIAATSSQQVKDILILRKDGTVILSATNTPSYTKLPLEQFQILPDWPGYRSFSTTEHDSMFEYTITPIMKKTECYRCHSEPDPQMGYLAAKISMDGLRAVAGKHRTMNIIMTAITLIGIGGVIVTALLLLVIQPVTKLRQQILRVENQLDRVEQGERVEFIQLEPSRSRDEISGLIDAFNKLLGRLNEAHIRLHELHQAQLEQADRLASTGEIAAGIAHEIKNPLAGVLGAMQVIIADLPEDHPRRDIIHEIIVQLERMNFAVNDLLSYARPTAPLFDETNLNDVIDRTLSLLVPQLSGKEITINRKMENGLPLIQADKKLLQQLIWNIALNGIEAMKSTGTLTVTCTKGNSQLIVMIEDTGEGIPEDIRLNIFKPFFSTKHKGTGLGLAICKRIVEQHHGTLHIQSEPEKGTIVKVFLPIPEVES
jgi:signal transduction histidine kinase